MKSSPHSELVPLYNEEYYHFLNGRLLRCAKRLWVAQYAINVRYADDTTRVVRSFLRRVCTLATQGVDVRVLLGGYYNARDGVSFRNEIVYEYLTAAGVKVCFAGRTGVHSHSKFVLIDDTVVIGSHNWSPRAFELGNDDSIAISQEESTRTFTNLFLEMWDRAEACVVPSSA